MNDIMVNQVLDCLKLQETMNSIVNKNWKNAGYRFERAAWLEMAEAMNPTDWKWWKKQEHDKFQTMLEMVDIFHFMLSDAIINEHQRQGTLVNRANTIVSTWNTAKGRFNVSKVNDIQFAFVCAETFISDAIRGELVWKNFFDVMLSLDISMETVLKYYISKNTLNIFRQRNGYKEGTYVKDWGGIEDNKFLESVADKATNSQDLYNILLTRYAEVILLQNKH